ncbi:hypothetical protein Dform_01908 [Dehalogenimonas formicexedens]|uniref:DUF2029 domain-containing protein n=1 Tax=Dehalogenimonas formicexedens TaxID=1839801 RepID=A0A1P8F9U9_9CHLR|nr:hypothetical protein [Dehalogenimonas formicexedens]APV45223.1 hypothetical protein Dform_01908 [Dehalogenimonas formicexedens]
MPETAKSLTFNDRIGIAFSKFQNRFFTPRFALFVFAVIFLAGATARIVAAPYSATQDMAQFWSFAQLFKEHGFDFYRYYNGYDPINPWQGWGYVYPPIWILILGVALAAVPGTMAGQFFVDTAWRIAEKAPIITADLAIGLMLFIAIPGSRWKKLFFSALWLLNPVAWYQSGVFGQFDAIAAAFLVGSLILLERGHDRWAFGVAALAVMTKQHTLIPVAFMMAATLRTMPWRRFAVNFAIFAGIAALFSVPFMVTGNILEYARAVVLPGQAPAYQEPLLYTFSGSGAAFTYLHDRYGWDTLSWFSYTIPVLVIAIIGGLVLTYLKRLSPLRAMLVGILLFIGLFYRINYQYLVIFIPLAILAMARTSYVSERIIALWLAIFPAVWLWYFNLSFWFTYLTPDHPEAISFFERIGLTHLTASDTVYLRIALAITVLCLAYTAFAFTRWKRPTNQLNPEEVKRQTAIQ